jgi:hypothetical protein
LLTALGLHCTLPGNSVWIQHQSMTVVMLAALLELFYSSYCCSDGS